MRDDEPHRVEQRLHGEDLDEARDALATAYHGVEWHADTTDQAFSFRYSAVGDQSITLRGIHFDGHIDGVMTPSDEFVVQWLTRGHASLQAGSDAIELEVGRPQLWPQQGAAFRFEDYDQRLVHIDREAVQEVARERGYDPFQLRLDHMAHPEERSLRFWNDTLRLVSQTVFDADTSPLLQAEMNRLGAVALLELYPVQADALGDDVLRPRSDRLRRVVEYVHANPQVPFTSTDLARVASLSVRALQQAFQRQMGTTPNGYVRRVRLARAREALVAGDPTVNSVEQVARTWGFGHAGRFAAVYFAEYGEYPRDTLHRP